ncbi:unnamed protein product [Tuber aestivum]|uniref:Uncharacterized protein n=1 Tax=Tuber aestivum TaxID=59557 RepID=A0A292Q551_9PEZI|nr:unnamed protein product [Tuber aestivum]
MTFGLEGGGRLEEEDKSTGAGRCFSTGSSGLYREGRSHDDTRGETSRAGMKKVGWRVERIVEEWRGQVKADGVEEGEWKGGREGRKEGQTTPRYVFSSLQGWAESAYGTGDGGDAT